MPDSHHQHLVKGCGADFWTDRTSVLFTSFWGWSPETWGTVGWTGDRGQTRRANLLKVLTDPFVTVCYVTTNVSGTDPKLKGMITGFYLVSHETGHRDEFTHPCHHQRSPDKWEHSLRAVRAFSYLPEYRLSVLQLDAKLLRRARHVAAMGELISDPATIDLLRSTPWEEVEVYRGTAHASPADEFASAAGMVKAGPANKHGYVISEGTAHLPRMLYVLRMLGDADAYLGETAGGRTIHKIGLAISPEMRREAFQKAMPNGAFRWEVLRTSRDERVEGFGFLAAVAGEYAMKEYLARHCKHLGGEFYLAGTADIDEAWRRGHAAARAYGTSPQVADDD